MIDPAAYRELVSGQKRGVRAALLRLALRVAETPYAWAVAVRNRRYDAGRAAVHQADAPVVSIGNLTVGGTGKTPLVEWAARRFAARGVRVAIVSRGYGAKPGVANDEAQELALALPDVPHVQDRDRVAAARQAVERFDSQLLLLDDGFQHRRLDRNFDIVLIDATAPFGYEHLLPRGLLRESLRGLCRADAVVLTRSDLVDDAERRAIERRVRRLAPRAVWCETRTCATHLLHSDGRREELIEATGRRAAAFCGIGNPLAFQATLRSLGVNVVAWRAFADHYAFQPGDLESLTAEAARNGAEIVLCTRKDLVKLQVENVANLPLRAVAIGLEFLSGEAELEAALAPVVRQEAPPVGRLHHGNQ